LIYKEKRRSNDQPQAFKTQLLSVGLNSQNLTATIHPGFEVNVMGAAQFSGFLVFNPGDCLHLLA
jgi:hypothetical protein